jgi:translocation and assembly module TamA
VQGRGFETFGRRDRAWIFHSNEAFGSTVEFTQVYAATRRSLLLGDRLKFHLRAEAGYTDAEVDEFVLDVGGQPLNLSFTTLPNFYRFKAGGSMSVRGYGFEQLSDNDIGSNHIITASAEAEYRFLGAWSGAAFADIGNAFNDWDDPDLKRGIGIGIRWYSFAGEIRLDVARAIDFEGKPIRYHLTIGTPLL